MPVAAKLASKTLQCQKHCIRSCRRLIGKDSANSLSSWFLGRERARQGCRPSLTVAVRLLCCVTEQMLLVVLVSSPRLRRSPSQTKAASDERHARAERLRERLAEARLARLQEQFAKQQQRAAANKVNRQSGSCEAASSQINTTSM